jgi:hypothetical protein
MHDTRTALEIEEAKEEAANMVLNNGASPSEAATFHNVSYDAVRARVKRRKVGIMRAKDHPALAAACGEAGRNIADVKGEWDKTDPERSVYYKFNEEEETRRSIMDDVKVLITELTEGITRLPLNIPKHTVEKALEVTIADLHMGMCPEPTESLFQYEYNPTIVREKLRLVIDACMKEKEAHGTFEVLFLDDLGDYQDGWSGYTTRGGHKLPQNMSNGEVFAECVRVKIELINELLLADVAKKIVVRCVSNDNHAGDFAEVVNTGIKMISDVTFGEDRVEVDVIKKFIEHRVYGNHCTLLTHGKDKKHMFKGLPLYLNDKTKQYINSYIDHYGIDSEFITVKKGDLHQLGYERTKRFAYRNYASFAPPSAWVQHNFGDTYSCFSVAIIDKWNGEIAHSDYMLNYGTT